MSDSTQLEITELLVSEVSQHPDNANNGDLEALKESIEVNGFFSPIIVQASTGYIIAGNHRWQVANELGMVTIPAIVLDVDDEKAKRMMLADNRITRLGRDDPAMLASVLEELSESDLGLMGTGFSHNELQTLLDQLDKPLEFESEPEDDGSYGHDAVDPYIVVPVAHEFTGECDSFNITRHDGLALMPTDLNRVRESLGLKRLTQAQVEGYEIEGWA